MTFELFMTALLIISSLTSLVTEAVKMICDEHKWKYHNNTLAGICALLLSITASVCYVIYTNGVFTPQTIVLIIALTFLSWLCAMVGYDKVSEIFKNLKGGNKDE